VGARRQETKERERAEGIAVAEIRQRTRAEELMTQWKIQRAENLFAADDAAGAIAWLAHVLRGNPGNRVAADRLLSALTHRNFALPILDPMQHSETNREDVLAYFSADGRQVTTMSSQGGREWEAETGRPLGGLTALSDQNGRPQEGLRAAKESVPSGETGKWTSTYFSQDNGPLMVSASISLLSPLQFSPDGEWLLTVDGTTSRVWDAQRGEAVVAPMKHHGVVQSARFSPDGQRVVTASMDWTTDGRIYRSETARDWSSSM
jgi:WD40 repeat protein